MALGGGFRDVQAQCAAGGNGIQFPPVQLWQTACVSQNVPCVSMRANDFTYTTGPGMGYALVLVYTSYTMPGLYGASLALARTYSETT